MPADATTSTLSGYQRLTEIADATLENQVLLARDLTRADYGLFALLDARAKWFGRVVGVDTQLGNALLPLCGLALLAPSVVTIDDLAADERYRGERVVSDAVGIRSLAAVAVRDQADRTIGVLAVASRAPRSFSALEVISIERVARTLGGTYVVRQDLDRLRDRHRTQLAALELREGVLRAASRFAVVAFDAGGIVRFWSVGAERLLGFAPREVVGRASVTAFFEPETAERGAAATSPELPVHERSFAALLAAASGSAAVEREWTLVRRDGSTLPASVVVSSTHDEDGGLTGYVAVAQDASERRAADRLKADFISIVSHELRTPLTSIRGSLGLLVRGVGGELPAPALQLLGIARDNVERLVRLVNDVLDLQKIEAGRVDYTPERQDLMSIVSDSIGATAPFAETCQVRLAPAGGPPEIIALVDRDQIVRVMTNLLSNAIKHSPAGQTVTTVVSVHERKVRVEVADRGAGVPAAFQPHVFTKFMQAEPAANARKHPGTGLGLSIVRAIVLQHGGRVGFDSEQGKGSVFWFELPLAENS